MQDDRLELTPEAEAYSYSPALIPPAKAINVLSGPTGRPQQTRSYLLITDLTSSPWRLQTQQGMCMKHQVVEMSAS
jgi:hypothetical protein